MKTSYKYLKKFLWLIIFSAAMAYLESAVVVYLRELYYPEAFTLSLQQIPFQILKIEIAREACAVVMLLSVAILTGKTKVQRIGAFLFCFGVWDIFYYVWLKALLNWPADLLDWDILFLIPTVWIGPVLAPALVSLGLIGTGVIIFITDSHGKRTHPGWLEWILIVSGCFIIFLSFIIDANLNPNDLTEIVYPWWMFILGSAISMIGIIKMMRQAYQN